jgi:hypothetical protein
MHGVKFVGLKKIKFDDLFFFEPEECILVDIVNGSQELFENKNFLTEEGNFIYDLEISYDARKLQDNRINAVKIELFLSPPNAIKNYKNINVKRADYRKFEFQEIANKLSRNFAKPFFEKELKFDIVLPNDNIEINKFDRQKLHEPLLNKKNIIIEKPIATQINESAAAIKVSFNKEKKQNLPLKNLTAKSANRFNLRLDAIDPAKIAQNAFTNLPSLNFNKNIGKQEIAPHFDPYDSISSDVDYIKNNNEKIKNNFSLMNNRNFYFNSKAIEVEKNTSIKKSLNADKINYGIISKENQDIKETILGHQFNLESYIKTKKIRLEIDKSDLGMSNYFYIKFTPLFKGNKVKNINLQSDTYQVKHADQIKNLIIPRIPPKIEKLSFDGKIAKIRLTQLDPTANKIKIIKKVITTDPLDNDPCTFFGEFDLNYNDKPLIIEDNEANCWYPNQLLYSAIIQYDDQDGPFDSIIFDGVVSPYINTNEQDDGTTSSSIIAMNEIKGIKIKIGEIAENVTLLTLYKENISFYGLKKERISVVKNKKGSNFTIIRNGINSLEFFDTDVKHNQKYRYFCVFNLKGGQKIVSNDDDVVIRKEIRDNLPLNVDIDEPIVETNENGNLEISIDVTTSLKESTFQFVKELLLEQNANQEFLDEIEQNRDELKEILVFYVERIDVKKGKKYELGFHKSGTFVDNENLARRLKLPLLKPGVEYIYNFTACLVPPSTFLAGTFNKFSSGAILGVKDITYLANKFDNYILKSAGILPSNAQLIKNLEPEKLILQGNTGIKFNKNITIPINLDVVQEIKLINSKLGTKINWTLAPQSFELIHYCHIFVTVNGKKELIGSVKNSGTCGNLYYVDDRYHQSIGERFYSVVAVFYNGNKSTEIESKTIKKLADINLKILKSMLITNPVLKSQTKIEKNIPKFNLNTRQSISINDFVKEIDNNFNNNIALPKALQPSKESDNIIFNGIDKLNKNNIF